MKSLVRTILIIAVMFMRLHALHAQVVDGAGATFPAPLYREWFHQFGLTHPEALLFNYSAEGSDSGRKRFGAGELDFAGSDIPVCRDHSVDSDIPIVQIPTVVGAVVPFYDVPGLNKPLQFSGKVLADIFEGKIKKWNHPDIAAEIAGVHLPSKRITIVHRSDGSGTNYIFTQFLSKSSREWREGIGVGFIVKWPTGNYSKAGEHNEGVAKLVRETPYSIGYVEYIYAYTVTGIRRSGIDTSEVKGDESLVPASNIEENEIGVNFGNVRNNAGRYVRADTDSISSAASSFAGAPENPCAQTNGLLDTDVTITSACPISSLTWLILPVRISEDDKCKTLSQFLCWLLTSGQRLSGGLGYSRLPPGVPERELSLISQTYHCSGSCSP